MHFSFSILFYYSRITHGCKQVINTHCMFEDSHQSSFHMASTVNSNTADVSRLWPVRAKPVLVRTIRTDDHHYDQPVHHGWTQSSTSLSSTGYESISSSSVISKRNSVATNLSTSTSSDDRQRIKSWVRLSFFSINLKTVKIFLLSLEFHRTIDQFDIE